MPPRRPHTLLSFILFAALGLAEIISRVQDSEEEAAVSSWTKFVAPSTNTTVTVGHDAFLACVVDDLNNQKVSWVKESTKTILTVHQSVVIKDERISLSYNDHRSWYLHIRNVTEYDRGWYICQINTNPAIGQSVYLDVLAPPKIVEDETSSDLIVNELSDVSLHCKAIGYPEPYYTWRRADGMDFKYNGQRVNVVDGETLLIQRVSRLHMGVYHCIAQNGISPIVKKKINLTVQFPPVLHIPNQLVGIPLRHNITLHCISEAFPHSINYWMRETGDLLLFPSDEKHGIELKRDTYTTNMLITIFNTSKSDYGTYVCESKNSLGVTAGVISLYEVASNFAFEAVQDDDYPTTIDISPGENFEISKGVKIKAFSAVPIAAVAVFVKLFFIYYAGISFIS